MSLELAVPSATRRRISLTPLIDVVFILLVFFMLETTFLTEAEVTVAAESRGGTPVLQQPLELELLDTDWVWLNSERVPYTRWLAALDSLSTGPDTTVQLRTAKGIPVQRLVAVLDALNARDITRISIGRSRGFAP